MNSPRTLRLVVNQQVLDFQIEAAAGHQMSIRARNGKVVIRQPRWASMVDVEAFARKHAASFLPVLEVQNAKFFSMQEQFILMWGVPRRFVHLAASVPLSIKLRGNQLYAIGRLQTDEDLASAVFAFARANLNAYLKSAVLKAEDLMLTSRHAIKVMTKSTNWATNVLKRKELVFNTNLFFYDQVATDYVIVHELAHDTEPNHGTKFWKLVEAHYPNYLAARQILRARPDLVEE